MAGASVSSSQYTVEDAEHFDNKGEPAVTMATGRYNWLAFWLLGLCNNYPYVIMLSAAAHILEGESHAGTGLVLLFDILPTLLVKCTAPFYVQRIPFQLRVFVVSAFSFLSFVIVAISNWLPMTLFGVACASFSSGLGEITFLALTHYYDQDTVGGWSSGTGMAGAAGAILYFLLALALPPRVVLLMMTVMPVVMATTYLRLLGPRKAYHSDHDVEPLLDTPDDMTAPPTNQMPLHSQLALLKPLLQYMGPLFLVYFAEYTINQGVVEHVWWDFIGLERKSQYALYQAMYQSGVLVSRSSTPWVRIRNIWMLSGLQCANLLFLLADARLQFIPKIWLYCMIVFYEGLLGGGTYVNAYVNITEQVPHKNREFSLGAVGVADTMGIALAAMTSLGLNKVLAPFSTPR